MLKNNFYFLFIILISSFFFSFTMPDRVKKKIKKEITKVFETKDFQLKLVKIQDSINNKLLSKIGEDNLFKIESNNKILGYAYVDKAPSKTDEFDYLILLDKNLIVAKTKVLVYREDYGGEIGSKRWLKQFIGKKSTDKLKYEEDIIAISGATISANSMTIAMNQFLHNLEILHKNEVL